MRVRWIKLDDRRHAFEVERGGREERVELETRSTLHHDFTHLALEDAAEIDDGFFGSLARGATLPELMGKDGSEPRYTGRMLEVERAVAMLQSLARTDADPAALHARITRSLAVQGESPPSWLTPELVVALRRRARAHVARNRGTFLTPRFLLGGGPELTGYAPSTFVK